MKKRSEAEKQLGILIKKAGSDAKLKRAKTMRTHFATVKKLACSAASGAGAVKVKKDDKAAG